MVRPRSCWVIYYFDTTALERRHQSFGRVTHNVAETERLSAEKTELCQLYMELKS
jgi:hypothetical protein